MGGVKMAFKITLNGANYVGASRQQAFESALAESKGTLGQLGESVRPSKAFDRQPIAAVGATASVGSSPAPATVVVQDYDRVLDGLERGLAKSYEHQSETLKVHQQYLSNQASYASIFAQLMQEQGTLFTDDAPVSGQSEVLLQVLQSLSRSVEQFHAHQADTLTVHSQFLDQQSTYSQAFVDLLQTHYGTALTGGAKPVGNGHDSGKGNGNGNGHHHVPAVRSAVNVVQQPVAAPEAVVAVLPQPVAPVPTTRVDTAKTEIPAPVAEPATAPTQVVAAAPVSVEELSTALLDIVSEKTGYPAEMLELEMDMEADLGIDSIKRVEILGALQDAYPTLPDVETDVLAELRTLGNVIEYMIAQTADSGQPAAAVAGATPDVVEPPEGAISSELVVPEPASADPVDSGLENLGDELLAIVSEKTGYPAEMLELEMDMEADLGIDSIKRVEILGALQDEHPDLPEVETEALSELRTLAQILDYMTEGVAAKKA
jgi:acyl carrier protein